MDLDFKDLAKKNFVDDYKDFTFYNPEANKKKYEHDLSTLKYIEENIKICLKSRFNTINPMKYRDFLNEFFYSEEFDKSVGLLEKKEEFEFITFIKRELMWNIFHLENEEI